MKINRNLVISIAISTLLLSGLFAWRISGTEQISQNQVNATPSSSPTLLPTPTESQTADDVPVAANSNSLSASNIWTYNCEIPVQLPEDFFLTCGDGGWYVHDIKWSSWQPTEARATAYFSQRVCEPSCVDGYRVEAPER